MISDVSKSKIFSALFFKKSFAFEFVSVLVFDSNLISHLIRNLIVNENHSHYKNKRLEKPFNTKKLSIREF
uniref:Uncharacterized protein n=1 Tax=uncultured marine bacterium EB0_41B09 TaxID=415438 RepID=A4GI42_9BACT|nr:hypothetical protein MBMO_EB0-41B09.0023 [uncultured marine bacterium EB0_41B09]